MWKYHWWCRWCGHEYKPVREGERDGFCSAACKMAHHRAWKEYVTAPQRARLEIEKGGNAKKRKKPKTALLPGLDRRRISRKIGNARPTQKVTAEM